MTWTINPSKEEIAMLMEAGFICRETKKFQEAHDVFAGVRALLPKSDVAEVALGTVFFHQSDFDNAIAHYQRALEKNPRSAYAYAHLGEAYLFKLEKEKARSFLQKAIELDARSNSASMARHLLTLADSFR
jgi:tetratricopeptide (TPR) repeat protein